jgi:hypothetical protein
MGLQNIASGHRTIAASKDAAKARCPGNQPEPSPLSPTSETLKFIVETLNLGYTTLSSSEQGNKDESLETCHPSKMSLSLA